LKKPWHCSSIIRSTPLRNVQIALVCSEELGAKNEGKSAADASAG
jgi:hypothetical protein